MVYVILLIVLVLLLAGGVFMRRKSAKRGFSYAPDPNSLGSQVYNAGAIPKVTVPTPEFKTEEIANDEFTGDMSDDLLDPNNPKHARWVHERPEMESDAEWVSDHPEDQPT